MPRARPSRGAWALALAPILFFGVFFAYPVGSIIGRGLDVSAFGDIVADRHLRSVAWFTLWQAVASTLLTVALAIPCAHVLSRYRFRGRGAVRAIITIPFVLPTVVVGAAFIALSAPGGPLGAIRDSIWLVLLSHVFFNYAVVVRTVGALWANLDPALEDAARVLGASPWQAFRYVTLPRLRPAVAAAASVVFLFTFTAFGTVLLLGGPRRATIEVEIYRRTAQLLDLRIASALAVIQLVGVGALLLAYGAVHDKRTRAQRLRSSRQLDRRPRPRDWAWIAPNLAIALVLAVVPMVVLLSRSVRTDHGVALTWFRALTQNPRRSTLFVAPIEAVRNSLLFAGAATVLALTLGGLASVVIARAGRSVALPRALDAFLMLPLATSAVTVGFGFLISLDRPPLDLRTSPLLIPIAHALVAIPLVIRTLVPVLRAVDDRLRQAAAVLGASPARIWREVDLPIAARAGLVAAAFAFVVSLGEFGATVFIARPDYPTLPIAIFRLLGQPGAANQGQAMAMAAILLVVTGTVVAAIDRVRVGAIGEF